MCELFHKGFRRDRDVCSKRIPCFPVVIVILSPAIDLGAGASLDSIATVLRHESTDSTAYYAKVDVELLRSVAQPWPEVPRC